MIETIDVKRIVPTEKQYAWTFGGVDPIARIKPGEVLDLLPKDIPWMNGVHQKMRARAQAVMATRR